MSAGEAPIKQAVKWIDDQLVDDPNADRAKLIDDASRRFDLTPPELEKVVQLQQALQQRPQLVAEIGGVYDPALDAPAFSIF